MMECPRCGGDTITSGGLMWLMKGVVHRYRECKLCGFRFGTLEVRIVPEYEGHKGYTHRVAKRLLEAANADG